MKEIPLGQGKVAIVDDEDYDFLMQWKWHAVKYLRCRSWYAVRYEGPRGQRKTIHMHREIMKLPREYDRNRLVDHRDHDGFNNQKTNLRVASHAENMRNRQRNVVSESGRKGVSRRGPKWAAEIKRDGVRYQLGYFTNIEDAAAAYDLAAARLHGEFAHLNERTA